MTRVNYTCFSMRNFIFTKDSQNSTNKISVSVQCSVFLCEGDSVCQVEGCLHLGLEGEDDGVQLVPHRGQEHPVFPADEESGAAFWSNVSRPRLHGYERREFCVAALRQEIQEQAGEKRTDRQTGFRKRGKGESI